MKMKNWMRNAGFTLVELIVVIAVLGILGAGAAVGYSGYVKKANKAADEALVAQIKYALEVAQVSDPMPDGAAAVVLSQTGAAVTGTTEAWVTNAMTDAFGANWANELKLQYGEWGKGAAVSKNVLEFFSGITEQDDKGVYDVVNGNAVPSFANDVDDLFVEVRDTAKWVSGKDGSGAALIQGAADLTAGEGRISSADFAKEWAGSEWNSNILMGKTTDEGYIEYEDSTINNEENKKNENFMAKAVANAGVLKARNTSLALYLAKQGVPQAVCDVFANFCYTGTKIPKDAGGAILSETGDAELSEAITAAYGDAYDAADTTLDDALLEYFGIVESEEGWLTPDIENTPAYKDGLAYYTMMKTINNINGNNEDDASYWDEMAGAVSLYGSVARGDADLASLKVALESVSDGSVAIAVMGNGHTISVKAQPKSIEN